MRAQKLFLITCLACSSAVTPVFSQFNARLKPDLYSAQYAGSIGTYSVGAGYLFWSERGQLDVFAGHYISRATEDLFTVTVKYAYSPWPRIPVGERWSVSPLSTGLSVSYTMGRYVWWPSHYPPDYYWWSPALRPNLFLGSSFRYKLPASSKLNAIGFYYELGSNEFKIIALVKNPATVSLWQIIHAGAGVRVYLH